MLYLWLTSLTRKRNDQKREKSDSRKESTSAVGYFVEEADMYLTYSNPGNSSSSFSCPDSRTSPRKAASWKRKQ